MSIKDTINDDLKAALLSGNRLKADVLRGLKAVILNEEVAKNLREDGLDDESIQQLIAREVKKRNESADLYKNAGRGELADSELSEAEILKTYLPKQLTDEELTVIIKDVIAELNNANMGQVIGAVKTKVGNSADGAVIARLVKEALS